MTIARQVSSRQVQKEFSLIVDDALAGRDTGILRNSRLVAVVVSAATYQRLGEDMPANMYKATDVSVTDIVRNALAAYNNDPIAALRSINATRRMYDLAEEQVLILALEQLGGDIATVEGRVDALTGDHK